MIGSRATAASVYRAVLPPRGADVFRVTEQGRGQAP